jgi:hypothetical protein
VQVGEGLVDHAEELLGLLGAVATEGVVDPIGGQQLVHGVEVPAVDDLLVETVRYLLVVLDWHGPSLPGCRACPIATARTIVEATSEIYSRSAGDKRAWLALARSRGLGRAINHDPRLPASHQHQLVLVAALGQPTGREGMPELMGCMDGRPAARARS